MKLEKGITLIALVVTIIVLLILAGVSILLVVGDNGILKKSQSAKVKTEIAREKEIISSAVVQIKASKPFENIEESEFSIALEQNSMEDNKATIEGSDDDFFYVKFAKDGRYYEVYKDGKTEYIENVEGSAKKLTIQCKNSNGSVLDTKIYTIFGNTYSKVPPQIEGYEAKDEKIEGEITEDNKEIEETYYLVCEDDTTLIFTGLDSNGNITTNENDIVSYMIGDGSSNQNNNALTQKGKSMLSVLRVPANYNGKPVKKIGNLAFRLNTTVKKAIISDTIETIGTSAFHDAYGLVELVLGESVNSIGNNGFTTASNLKKITFRCKMQGFGEVFTNTARWTEIGAESNKEFYKVIDNVLYSADGKTLIIVPKGKSIVTIADGTENLANNAFSRCYNIKNLDIPDSVKSIGNQCFGWDSQIKSYIIGENVKDVASGAFHMDSSSLSEVYIKSSTVAKNLTSQDSVGKLIKFGVKNIYIKSDITDIGSYVTSNYTETTTDKTGYKKYVKDS